MLVKGTLEYKKAQELADTITRKANTTKINSFFFDLAFDDLYRFIVKIKALDIFAAKVAETVDKGMTGHSYYVAKVSDKQSWILACAAVENNIEI